MPPTARQGLEGQRFRRKHLSLMLGGLDAMAAFKSAVGSTPGRVHPNVARATPFFANRGPSRRIGTVVNTYALTLRPVNDTENLELEKLFFDENAILLPSRLACTVCTDGRVKCFARRRDSHSYVCAASNEAFGDDDAVLQWVAHWRESAPYDYCGSEAEWLTDLDEVINSMRQNVPQHDRRWPANTNADQLVRAGVVGEEDLDHEPPRKRRHVSPDRRDKPDVRPAPRRSNEGPHLRNVSGASHHRSVSNASREHDCLPSPAATSRSANSPLDAEHRHPYLAMTEAHHLSHPSLHQRPRGRSTSSSVAQPHLHESNPPQLHPNSHPYHQQHHPQPHVHAHGHHSRRPSVSSSRSRANSHQPPSLPLVHAPSPQVHPATRSASYSQPTTPTLTHQPQGGDIVPRAKEYYYTLQGHLEKAMILIRADEAALGAVGVGLEQLDLRKAELHEEQKRLKIDIRDRTNEVRRMREEMMALRNDERL